MAGTIQLHDPQHPTFNVRQKAEQKAAAEKAAKDKLEAEQKAAAEQKQTK